MPAVRILAAAFAALLAASPAGAEEKHHPEGKEATPAPRTQPMPQRGGMMRMDQCEPGMGMMCMMGMRPGRDMGRMGMGPAVDQRLAALKVQLKVTEAQTGAWNAYAAALRDAAKAMDDQRKTMMEKMGASTLPQRLDLHEAMLVSHLEHLRKVKAVAAALYAVLSDDQKKAADRAMMGPLMGGRMHDAQH